MKAWSRILFVLVLVFTGVTSLYVWQKYHINFIPRDLCYTRDGAVVGSYERNDPQRCFGTSAVAYEQRTIGPPQGPLDSDSHQVCQKACQKNEWCTHYIYHLPWEYHNANNPPPLGGPGQFGCTLLKQKSG